MNTKKINKQNTLMVAHRGLSGIEKENTLAAFIAAGNRSYYGIETDVHLTKDGKFIILHDSDPERVSQTKCIVEETDFDVLRRIYLRDIDGNMGRTDLRLPSLEEYIRTCKRYEKKCVLEIKTPMNEEQAGRMIDVIKGEDYLENVIFISFDFKSLVNVRKILPEQPIQYLFGEINDEIWSNLKKYNIDIDMYFQCCTKEIVDKAHKNGIKVNCWTVDNPEDGERLAMWGVDFITSNILE